MRAYVGVTDNNWYRFLADRPGVTEVNFWQPSGAREFRVLAPGEPFFFKTHYPHNRLVGGGFFSDSARLRVSEAWEFFGEANGVASIEEMRARIGRYRRTPISADEDPLIGCLFVTRWGGISTSTVSSKVTMLRMSFGPSMSTTKPHACFT